MTLEATLDQLSRLVGYQAKKEGNILVGEHYPEGIRVEIETELGPEERDLVSVDPMTGEIVIGWIGNNGLYCSSVINERKRIVRWKEAQLPLDVYQIDSKSTLNLPVSKGINKLESNLNSLEKRIYELRKKDQEIRQRFQTLGLIE